MRSVDSLLLHKRIPERIQNDDLRGFAEVETSVTRLERHQHDVLVGLVHEFVDSFSPAVHAHAAVVTLILELLVRQGNLQEVQERRKLGEYKRLLRRISNSDRVEKLYSLVDLGRRLPLLPKTP